MRDLPPLAAFEAAALVRGEHGADKGGLGSAISLAVVSMLRRERYLQQRGADATPRRRERSSVRAVPPLSLSRATEGVAISQTTLRTD